MTWVTPTTWTPSTAITAPELQKISDNLQHLKDAADALDTELDAVAPSPAQRAASYVSGSTWNIGAAYQTGKLAVYLNGALRVQTTEWTETSTSGGTITFTFSTSASDRVDVLDWSA